MAKPTLTRDNHRVVFSAQKDSLAGLNSNTGKHLVVVKQMTTWSNKEFVVTPTYVCYNQGWSCGQEVYPNVQGGVNVYNDTNTLINNVRNSIDTHDWKVGNCALFAISSRTAGPYAWYQYYAHYDASMPNPQSLSEYGASVVAYKFNLRHLHFSKMTSFNVYVRVWAPSLVLSYPPVNPPDDGILIKGGLYNSGSCLMVKFFTDLPTRPAWNISDSGDSFEFANNCNNGQIVYQDTTIMSRMVNYAPFGLERASYSTWGNSSRIYTLQDNCSGGSSHPTNFYHDFQVGNSDNLNILKKNPGEIWVVAHFHMGNAFSQGANNMNGLGAQLAATVFAERIELILKCTSTRFNY